MKSLTVTEAARHFSDLVSRVHYQGESAVLTKGGRPMVRLSPVRRARNGSDLAERWQSRARLSPQEAEAFSRDLAHARRQLPSLRPAWD